MERNRLKAVRAGHQGVITKFTHELDESLVNTDEPAGDKVGSFNAIYEQLQNKLNVLQKIDDEVLTVCSVEHIEQEIEESKAVSAKVLAYKQQIEVFLNSTSASFTGPLASVATSSNQDSFT